MARLGRTRPFPPIILHGRFVAAAGTSETPPPGGAVAGGTAPVARIAGSVGGGVGAGTSPLARVAAAVGGGTGAGTGPPARVAVSVGGGVAGGTAPTVPSADTPTPGGATAGGTAPSALAAVGVGGAASTLLFGLNTVGGVWDNDTAGTISVTGPYYLDSSVTFSKFVAYSKGFTKTGGSGTTQGVHPLIYADDGSQTYPDELLAYGSLTTISETDPAVWRDYPFGSPVTLAPGWYWLGFVWDGPADEVHRIDKTAAGLYFWQGSADPNAPPDPWPTAGVNTDAGNFSMYAAGFSTAAARVATSVGGAVAGGTAPTVPLQDTPGRGGAIGAGTAPGTAVATPIGGGVGGGFTHGGEHDPPIRVAVTAGGAIAHGTAPSAPDFAVGLSFVPIVVGSLSFPVFTGSTLTFSPVSTSTLTFSSVTGTGLVFTPVVDGGLIFTPAD